MSHTTSLEQTTGQLDQATIDSQITQALLLREPDALESPSLGLAANLESSEAMQRAHRLFERIRRDPHSDEGSASTKVLVGAVCLGVIAAAYVAGMYHDRGFTIPGIDLHVPNFFSPDQSVGVKAQAGLNKVEPKDDIIVATGIGYTYTDIIYKATSAGPKWSINPTYVKQRGTAIYGTPPATFQPPSSFKDSEGHYQYSAAPVLEEVIPGSDIHLSLGDRGKDFADANRFYIIATVADNRVHTNLIGQPVEHSDMNFQARIGNIKANADMGSYTTAASVISVGNYTNSCGDELAPVAGSGLKEDVARIVDSAAEILQEKGEKGDKEAADEAKVLLNMDDPQSIVVNYVHEETQTTPSGNSKTVQVPVDKLTLPHVSVDDKASLAEENNIPEKDLTFSVDTTCHMDKATQDKIDAYKKDAILQPSPSPVASPSGETSISPSPNSDLKAKEK